jgi:hypothetical protein
MFNVITLQDPVLTPVNPDVGLKVFSDISLRSLQQLAKESAESEI